MTGFGEARFVAPHLNVGVEIRAVNNRHFKLAAKISEPFAALEPEFEKLIRDVVRRGTIQLAVRVDRPRRDEDYRLNPIALRSYLHQAEAVVGASSPCLSGVLALPGVVETRREAIDDPREEWPTLSQVVNEALGKFQASRAEEGKAMAEELISLSQIVADQLGQVEARGPHVVASYQARLEERVKNLLQGRAMIEPKDLIREVAILAERADVAEEIIRLRAHLHQYSAVIAEPESAGRKLEFVVQEMGREINTMGSKANDIEISRSVVEMKGALEKIRELIQNVE